MKLDDIYNRIGDKIHARRRKNGEYVKADIAKELKVTPQDISNWAFRNKFPWEELFTFSQKHKISFDFLLTGKQQTNFMCGWHEQTIKLCNELKEILDNSEEEEKTAVLSAIRQAKKIKELKNSTAGRSSERRPNRLTKKKAM